MSESKTMRQLDARTVNVSRIRFASGETMYTTNPIDIGDHRLYSSRYNDVPYLYIMEKSDDPDGGMQGMQDARFNGYTILQCIGPVTGTNQA